MYIKTFKFKTKDLTFRSFASSTNNVVLYPLVDCQSKLIDSFIAAVRKIEEEKGGAAITDLENNPIIEVSTANTDGTSYTIYNLIFKDVNNALITKNNLITYMVSA